MGSPSADALTVTVFEGPARAGGLPTSHAHERGDVISGWLIKLAVSLAVVGLIAFDGISVATAQLSLTDDVAGAAREAVDAAVGAGDYHAAHPAAEAFALEQDPTNVVSPDDVNVASDGATTVTVHRTAPTLILFRLGPLADWAEREATTTAKPLR